MDEINPAEANSSELALRVALQTMTERCKSLQKRLNTIEDEYIGYRSNQVTNDNKFNTNIDVIDTKQKEILLIDELKRKIIDLEQQKIQLNDHISMVSNENRQLWSRLSDFSKERNNVGLVKTTTTNDTKKIIDIFENENDLNNCTGAPGNEKNLIRSKTFTQHAPNPNLRYKNIDINETSLEEITLNNNLTNENFGSHNIDNSFGFSYLNYKTIIKNNDMESDEINNDVILDTKNCIDGILDFKRQQLNQYNDLINLYSELKKRIALKECSKCNLIKSNKPETAEKSSETEESSNDEITTEAQANLIKDKVLHIDFSKTCPMCGAVFNSQVTFESFLAHVEDHFLSTNDEHLEYISHVVGDF